MDPLRLWQSLKKRWQLVVGLAVVGAFLGAVIAKKYTSQTFEATAVIGWEPKVTADRAERMSIVESITLPSVMETVEKRTKLGPSGRDLLKFVEIGASDQSNNVMVKAVWATGEGAATLANAVVDAFIEIRKKLVKDKLMGIAARYRDAVTEADKQRAKAGAAYEEFRKKSGVSDITGERELAITQYAELMARATSARAQALTATEQAGRMGDEAAVSPSKGPALSAAESDADATQAAADAKRLPEAQSELARAKVQFSDDHPNVRRISAEVEAIQARQRQRGVRGADPGRKRATFEAAAKSAAARQKAAEELQGELKKKLDTLSTVEGQAAVLLGELKVADEARERSRQMLIAAELEAADPPTEFTILEHAKVPNWAKSSPRRKVAIAVPIVSAVLALLLVILWPLRKLDVCTPKEAAFWSGVPVVGASTWPRDPDMLTSLMHDLDDFAPSAKGVTLIVGLSIEEAQLARKVAEWDGHRMVSSVNDPQRLLAGVKGASTYPLAPMNHDDQGGRSVPPASREGNTMQILTLTGPVPAQALRRAARLADRVLVVVASGAHSLFQLTKIRGRLGRDEGIGVLLVGLEKDYALVRDRVGDVDDFWSSVRSARLPGQTDRPEA